MKPLPQADVKLSLLMDCCVLRKGQRLNCQLTARVTSNRPTKDGRRRIRVHVEHEGYITVINQPRGPYLTKLAAELRRAA